LSIRTVAVDSSSTIGVLRSISSYCEESAKKVTKTKDKVYPIAELLENSTYRDPVFDYINLVIS